MFVIEVNCDLERTSVGWKETEMVLNIFLLDFPVAYFPCDVMPFLFLSVY